MTSVLGDVVDLSALAAWMDEQGLPTGGFDETLLLSGGTQNILGRISRGGRAYVLRRPPLHLRTQSNANLLREARILGALTGKDVASPALVATCDDTSIIGAVFLLMEAIDGFSPATTLPALHAGDPAIRREMGLNAAAELARLGAIDHVAVGLADFGRPEGFLERQVPRWSRELASYDVSEIDVDDVAAWLAERIPPMFTPGILHGDYHLANLMYARDSAKVAAIVDWEMSTIGDPLLDLGWLLATWPVGPGSEVLGTLAGALATSGGLPSQAELIEEYARGSSRDLTHIRWYAVLACFKLAIILEGTYSRSRVGKAPVAVGDMLHTAAVALIDRANTFMEESW